MNLFFKSLKLLKLDKKTLSLEYQKIVENYQNAQDEYCALFHDVKANLTEEEITNWNEKFKCLDETPYPFAYAKVSKDSSKEIKRLKKNFRELKSKINKEVKNHNESRLLILETEKLNKIIDFAKSNFYGDKFIDIYYLTPWLEQTDYYCVKNDLAKLQLNPKYHEYKETLLNLRKFHKDLLTNYKIYNKNYIIENISKAKMYLDKVENNYLDNDQIESVIKDVQNHLIIAGAGTGKTTTIVGKIKYLLNTKACKPSDILVLSFTNASASEMSERIKKETRVSVEASTFHKLGLNIISAVDGVKPRISNINLQKFLKDQIKIKCKNKEYLLELTKYLLFDDNLEKYEFDFENIQEYNDYLKAHPAKTFKGEEVKSYGELDIANFLCENGIKYEYEKEYKVDTRDLDHGVYRPDFYLPDYDIYIEYYGIDRDGNVANCFKSINGVSASKLYRDSMKWKENIHKANNTRLISCFAYEKQECTLLDNLKKKLLSYNVVFKQKSAEELIKESNKNFDRLLIGAIDLFETVINLIKSNNCTIDEIRNKCKYKLNRRKLFITLYLIEPLFNEYEKELRFEEAIDFNDMINLATKYITDGKYINPYKYVIVDEYQDISMSRFKLLKALRDSNNYKLFAVGDDWQSIYRFAGSDIGFILNFSKYWGPTEESRIQTTYRFSQKLIDLSSIFIQKNKSQIKKNIKGVSSYDGEIFENIKYSNDAEFVSLLSAYLNSLELNSSVFLIGRYSFDLELVLKSDEFESRYDNLLDKCNITLKDRPDLKITFLTAHKSKGLQADYVFILNNKNSTLGFPSKIINDPILNILLEDSDTYPFSEERRLFYVSLTRAKKQVFLLTPHRNQSIFSKEITIDYNVVKKPSIIKNKRESKSQIKAKPYERRCPLCGGKLVLIHGPYGDFWGCSNFKKTGCRYKEKI